MNRKMGKYFRNRILIQLGIEWVLGPLKFQLMMTTVTRMETVFIMNVNNRYLAMRGRTSDVGGKIFDTSRRNTTSERRMLMPEEKNSHILEKYHTKIIMDSPPKMEKTLFVPSKLMEHRKFMMSEFPSMNTLDWVR